MARHVLIGRYGLNGREKGTLREVALATRVEPRRSDRDRIVDLFLT